MSQPAADWTPRYRTEMPEARKAILVAQLDRVNADTLLLRNRLLDIDGSAVALGHGSDPDAKLIMERGRLIVPGRVIRVRGESKRCHTNAAFDYLFGDHTTRICTGYALAGDGCWRRHSWGIAEDGRVVETTVDWLLYFGADLTEEEADRFAALYLVGSLC